MNENNTHAKPTSFLVGIWAVVALVGMLLAPVSTAWAQLGDVVQEAAATAPTESDNSNEVSVDWPQDPTPGNLLLAMMGHRVDWVDAEMLNDGWSLAIQRNDEEFDTSSRRGMAIWYKIAEDDEPQTVTTRWSNSDFPRNFYDCDGSCPRHSMTVIQEIEGHFPILDVTSSASSYDDDVNTVTTGFTPTSRGQEKVVVGAVISRGDADDAHWEDGAVELFDNRRREAQEQGDGAPVAFTIQTARRYATSSNSWEARATWDGDDGGAFGLMAVFSDASAGDYFFHDNCSPKMEFPEDEEPLDSSECVFDVDHAHWTESPDPDGAVPAPGVPDDPGVAKIRVRNDNTGLWEDVPHASQSGNIGDWEACPDSSEYCLPGGKCRHLTKPYACDSDSQCEEGESEDLFCHDVLGCIDVDLDCRDEADPHEYCEGVIGEPAFCWRGKCMDGDLECDPDAPPEEQCDGLEDYDVCHPNHTGSRGVCRDANDQCFSDDVCDDGTEFCHEFRGCEPADQQCSEGCDSNEFCFEGLCWDEGDQCEPSEGGWVFVDGPEGERTQIELVGDYCENIGSGGGDGHYTTVETRLACNCYSLFQDESCICTGSNEPIDNDGGSCPSGFYNCGDTPLNFDPACDNCSGSTDTSGDDNECPFHCPEEFDNIPCNPDCEMTYDWILEEIELVCDGIPLDPLTDTIPDYFDDDIAMGRCDERGFRITCDGTGLPQCEERNLEFRPMPEVCDGLDNSCDGKVNNIEESWDNFRNCEGTWHPDNWLAEWGDNPCGESGYEIEDVDDEVFEGLACFERDICSCPEDAEHFHTSVPEGSTIKEEFDAHISGWDPDGGCRCAASMGF